MYRSGDTIKYSPSDLITFMESPYASALERMKLDDDTIESLMDQEDALLASLAKQGLVHEDAYTQSLKDGGHEVLETKRATPELTEIATREALLMGKEVITQGYLSLGQFGGFADFLVKVPGESRLGNFHYEVWDTKLSRKMKPYFAIQLCCYAEMLEAIQGIRPETVAIVLGDQTRKRLRVENYFAYYKALKRAFLLYHEKGHAELPNPALSASHGQWTNLASKQLAQMDHLSQVANLTRNQVKNLEAAGIRTMQELADTKEIRIAKMAPEVFAKAKLQAGLQIESRGKDKPVYVIQSHDTDQVRGLKLLPPHSDLDVFFDIEGYPAINGGLEYLWGNTYYDEGGKPAFRDFWAHDADQEKQIFMEFIDWIYARWKSDPAMHVYHYANYEIAAIRKLMGRYGVREEEVDNLLRNNVFVDLYNVVRHGLVIGEPNYSIKSVEHIYRGRRDTEVASGGESVVVYEAWRENPDGDTWQTSAALHALRDYNKDDCDSTMELAQWLRAEQKQHKIRFELPPGEGEKELEEEILEITSLRDQLRNSAESEADPTRQSMMETLAWSLEFHRRENKPTWWRFFDRMGWDEHDLYEDMDCLAGLTRTGRAPFLPKPRARNHAYEYGYDTNQPYKGQGRNFYVQGEGELMISCCEHDADEGLIAFQHKEPLPDHLNLVPNEIIQPKPIPEAIQDVVETLSANGFRQCAITDFLLRKRPRIRGNSSGPIIKEMENLLPEIIKAASNLEDSYLCIQGPPGAGKTYTAKHMIGQLLRDGKRVGIASNSHKAIMNLLTGVAEHVQDERIPAELVKIGGDKADPQLADYHIPWVQSASKLENSPNQCVGGTAWAFSHENTSDTFDYLFVDEAGQVSVANLIGMSRSCNNIILMGDQMQLGQPIQGAHPGESGHSILEYLLQDQATISDDMGVFLDKTWRMHPDVCSLVSGQVYEGKLRTAPVTRGYEVNTTGPLITKKAGICFVPVEHEGNSQGSEEEVEQIVAIADELIGSSYWPDDEGRARFIDWNDILFVAPYNYQVNLLRSALGEDALVGSVDKFQGQEAPIVILSMCASDASETPRGIDFLFSKNRLNVAISRAQALAIVVGSPALANTPVNTLEQMELVNFFCEMMGVAKCTA